MVAALETDMPGAVAQPPATASVSSLGSRSGSDCGELIDREGTGVIGRSSSSSCSSPFDFHVAFTEKSRNALALMHRRSR